MDITLLYLSVCVLNAFASSDTEKEVLSLELSPSVSQFLVYSHVTLSCVVRVGRGVLKRSTTTRGTESCSYGWGSVNGSTCAITTMYPSDSGVYWCESPSGKLSQTVDIKVTVGPVLLESPVLPVMEGDDVTMICRNKTTSPKISADFYKDGVLIVSSSTGEMTIHSVSKSDEGFYKCSIFGAGESAENRLTVRAEEDSKHITVLEPVTIDPITPGEDPEAPSPLVMSYFWPVRHVVVGIPYILTTVLLGLIYRDKRRESQRVSEDRRHHVIMDVE